MLATIMVVFVLLTAGTDSTSSGHPVLMPRDLSQLVYPGSSAADSAARIWTKADLDRASSVLNYEQMWPVIRRLEAGLPITVLALGDSITKDYGGCFHRDRCVTAGQPASRQDGGRETRLAKWQAGWPNDIY